MNPADTPPATSRLYPAGVEIFRVGDAGEGAYLIESGSVEVLAGEPGRERRINVMGRGQILGEIALLDGKPRTATVRTLEPTRLIVVPRAQLDTLLSRADPVVRHLIEGLLKAVRRAGLKPGEMLAEDSVQDTPYESLMLAHELDDAIAAHQVDLHYQPILCLINGSLAGFEALVRWRHPVHGLIEPAGFVPLAENLGLIHRLSEFTLQRAMRDWVTLRALCPSDLPHPPFMSVNVSGSTFCREGMVERVAQVLAGTQCPPGELRLEITESAIIPDLPAALVAAERLRAMGVGLALDDYGQGYAALDSLQSLPFSCLKIDKAFIDRMLASSRSYAIIRSTLELAKSLGMSTVAEGVEDAHTATLLAGLGCSYAQGFHFAAPMPIGEVADWQAARSQS